MADKLLHYHVNIDSHSFLGRTATLIITYKEKMYFYKLDPDNPYYPSLPGLSELVEQALTTLKSLSRGRTLYFNVDAGNALHLKMLDKWARKVKGKRLEGLKNLYCIHFEGYHLSFDEQLHPTFHLENSPDETNPTQIRSVSRMMLQGLAHVKEINRYRNSHVEGILSPTT